MKPFAPGYTPAGTDRRNTLAFRFTALRERHGLSIKDMAARVGLSESAYRAIERGQTRMVKEAGTLARTAAQFGVSQVWLYAGVVAAGKRLAPPPGTSSGLTRRRRPDHATDRTEAPAGTFPLCNGCKREPLHVVTLGRHRDEASAVMREGQRHSLECPRCGTSTLRHPTLELAHEEWGTRFAQLELVLPPQRRALRVVARRASA